MVHGPHVLVYGSLVRTENLKNFKSQSRKQRDVTLQREEKQKQEFKSNEGIKSKIKKLSGFKLKLLIDRKNDAM